MRLITLGTAAAGVPRGGDAGSGHLLEHGSTRILVDCGSGVLGLLTRHARLETINAVYLSHLHNDHVADLYPLALWARFTRRKLPVYGPVGMRTLLYRWFSLFTNDPDPYVQALQLTEFEPWTVYTVGEVKFMACPVEHNVASFAMRAEAGGCRFVYSGDTRAGALLQEAAQDADLFLAEATFQDLPEGVEGGEAPPRGLRGGVEGGEAPPREKSRDHHMTAREAGVIAKLAGVRRLVLTHIKYDLDPDVSRAQALDAFGGPVEVAVPGAAFDVRPAA